MLARFRTVGNISTIFLRAFLVLPALSEHIVAKRSGPTEFIVCGFFSSGVLRLWFITCLDNQPTEILCCVTFIGRIMTLHKEGLPFSSSDVYGVHRRWFSGGSTVECQCEVGAGPEKICLVFAHCQGKPPWLRSP